MACYAKRVKLCISNYGVGIDDVDFPDSVIIDIIYTRIQH